MGSARARTVLVLFTLLAVVAITVGLDRAYVAPVLMYHHIDERAFSWKLSVSPESFYRQMEFLKAHRYRVLSLSEYITLLKEKEPVPKKSVVITFDDGYLDNATDAFPVLRALGFPATVFVEVNKIGGAGYMTLEDLAILADNGIEIGSHTLGHEHLPDLDQESARKEISGSKRRLEALMGRTVRHFSYPGGGFNAEIRQAVVEAGYEGAVATHPGPFYPSRDPYALKRIRISRSSDNLLTFWFRLSGFYTYFEEFRG